MEQMNKKFVLNVSFGGKTISLSSSQAKKYALLGLEAEKHSEAIEILKNLAKSEGISPNEFMNKLKTERYNALKNSYLEKLGGDEALAEKLMQLENFVEPKTATKKAIDKITGNFAEYKSIDDLPDEVVLISELKGISLFDALLRYKFYERKKAEKEQQNRQKNFQNSVGSLKTNDVDYGLSYINAMLKGINN